MTTPKKPPPVSTIVGRRQIPALRWAIRSSAALALGGILLPKGPGHIAAVAAIVIVSATPVVRVMWLVWRWHQESDRRFVALGLGLLGVVASGAIVSILGVGR